MDRQKLALAHLNVEGRGLEIGPSYRPLVPKASGKHIEIVDHADRETLVEKYRGWGLPEEELSAIEEVDHVWTDGSLAELVGEVAAFDYVVAAHVIEHTVDLIGFLQDCSTLLKVDGVLALVVPDKRYCFDRFQPHSTVGAVVDAHLYHRRFHTPGTLLDHHAYAAKRGDSAIAWGEHNREPLELQFKDIASGREVIAAGYAQDQYHDVHRWRFTPSSFRLLVRDLRDLGYHDFAEVGGSTYRRVRVLRQLGEGWPPREQRPAGHA